ncbi:MAG: alpha/beta hydrolase [Terracidiphilus sp.]|jgi:pimeloyl-ACP methyl ester carboxylesterase
MQTTHSADGTPIAYWREGSGPPLLLVHGGACDHLAWHFVVPLLAEKFTVYSYDRRGRGESGDTDPYSVEREIEDVAAMLATIGAPAHLLGHSAGGILALEAAQRTSSLLSLILYEPAYVVNGARERPGAKALEKVQALLAEGNRDEVIRIAMRETLGLPESEIAAMGAGPGWEHLIAVAHTIPYDWKLWDQPLVEGRARAVETRALVLMGSESPAWLQAGATTVAAALPNARLEVLPGQEHLATVTAPEMFAQAVLNFIEYG